MNVRAKLLCVLALATATASCASGTAAPAGARPTPTGNGPAAGRASEKSIAEVTKASRRHDGLFTLFQDTVTGAVHMLVKPDQLGQEYIYWSYTADGVVDAGHFRGAFGDSKVIGLERRFDRLAFVTQPTHLYFDASSPLARAEAANVSPAVIGIGKIVARDTASGELLIEANDLFATEALRQVKRPTPPNARPGQFFSLGRLSPEKTVVSGIRSYPLNTDVLVEYVYDNDAPLNGGGEGVLDPRSVMIRVQHSLIAMPENGYQPRFDDARVGFFTDRQTDMVSADAAPYRDLITRWNLVKKDPSASISEPVEPILWWIENTTPHELRETIREATLSWNEAFEAAGFRNAIEVRVQPDDADWDAGDIRYNVLRWTSSPNPPFGGYGPSFTNPRTGQILGADVMLEWVAVTNRLRREQIFEVAALPAYDEEPVTLADGDVAFRCDVALELQRTMLVGQTALAARAAPESELQEFTRQFVRYLILHEVGHTLGLNHNMMASHAVTADELQRRGSRVTGSVMDYPAVNLAAPGETQGDYYDWRPSAYDRWAIEYGYSAALEDEAAEQARLEAILIRSTDPRLAFGNDADDMRAPGKAIDPRINTGDLSRDGIAWATGRVALVNELMNRLRGRFNEPGDSYHALRNAYMILTAEQATALAVVSRYIGGVYRDRAVIGQDGATKPFTAVTRADQKRAMEVLVHDAFAPDAWAAPDGLIDHLMMQRRGFDFFRQSEDPKVHDRVLMIQSGVLAHLLHPVTMRRITDSRLYGNEYPLAEVLADLTNAVFAADARGNVNTFRQNLQVEYVNRLIGVYETETYDHIARSGALQSLRRIETLLRGKTGVNTETRAHTGHVLHRIRTALEAD
ncbi:MAG: zinc-dependent metalloprotease [Longimicrobiales bacterium]